MTFKPEVLLADAVAAARRALLDLDSERRPAVLRRVAAYGGGNLPPPFARSLLDELECNEVLRGRALEMWPGDRPPTGGAELASYLFLTREDGWATRVLAIAHDEGAAAGSVRARQAEVEKEARVEESVGLRERLRKARRVEESLRGELREAQSALREPRRADKKTQRRIAADLAAEKAARHREVAALGEEIAALQKRLEEVRGAARREKLLRAETVGEPEESRRAPPRDALDLAEQLDALADRAMALAPTPEAALGVDSAYDDEVVRFDRTIAPDDRMAIDWLLAAGRRRVLIDGYNLGFALGPREPGAARTLAVEAAGRLAASSADLRITVVFDSSRDPEGSKVRRDSRVEVRFTAPELTADDEIVTLVAADRQPVVVVSNDRELRDRAESAGADALWSDALASWARRR